MQSVAEQSEVQYIVASCCAFGLKKLVFELATYSSNFFEKMLLLMFGIVCSFL